MKRSIFIVVALGCNLLCMYLGALIFRDSSFLNTSERTGSVVSVDAPSDIEEEISIDQNLVYEVDYLGGVIYLGGVVPDVSSAEVLVSVVEAYADGVEVRDRLTVDSSESFDVLSGSFRVEVKDPIYFTDSDIAFSSSSDAPLRFLEGFLVVDPASVVLLQGYSHKGGDSVANEDAALSRAGLVASWYLDREKVSDGQVSTVGAGETDRFGVGDDEESRRKNRRVMVSVDEVSISAATRSLVVSP